MTVAIVLSWTMASTFEEMAPSAHCSTNKVWQKDAETTSAIEMEMVMEMEMA